MLPKLLREEPLRYIKIALMLPKLLHKETSRYIKTALMLPKILHEETSCYIKSALMLPKVPREETLRYINTETVSRFGLAVRRYLVSRRASARFTIIGGIRGTNHQKLYKESGFCTLKERRKRHKLLMFHKMILGLCSQYISDLFSL